MTYQQILTQQRGLSSAFGHTPPLIQPSPTFPPRQHMAVISVNPSPAQSSSNSNCISDSSQVGTAILYGTCGNGGTFSVGCRLPFMVDVGVLTILIFTHTVPLHCFLFFLASVSELVTILRPSPLLASTHAETKPVLNTICKVIPGSKSPWMCYVLWNRGKSVAVVFCKISICEPNVLLRPSPISPSFFVFMWTMMMVLIFNMWVHPV